MGCDISLHALPLALSRFQSTHPHGVRRYYLNYSQSYYLFQSTHPHGVRHNLTFSSSLILCFNPRTHMGCDALNGLLCRFCARFQSTHPHGVRHISQKLFDSLFEVSIHAPTWGATEDYEVHNQLPGGFNPRTHMGCDCIFSNRLNITMQR